MLNLLLSILFSAALLMIFRLFPRYGIRSFQAITFNYFTCVGVGALFLPSTTRFFTPTAELALMLFLGLCFFLTFTLTSLTVQRVGVTVASLATNLSLVLPVLFSLLVLGTGSRPLNAANYAGMGLALVAIGLASVKKAPGPAPTQESTTGAWAALLPVVVFLLSGSNNALTNYLTAQGRFSEVEFTWLAFLGAAFSAGLVLVVQMARGRERFHARSAVGGIVLGLGNYFSYLFLVRALSDFGGNGALLFPLYNLGTILVAAGVAVLGFRERLSGLNWLGLGLALGALGLLVG
ncbi:MAG: EamA/RhaT family transporter [Sphingobacteriaceae bacterium]|nr:EamA/RhaT family transporter [Cytophagaceae bacterium]